MGRLRKTQQWKELQECVDDKEAFFSAQELQKQRPHISKATIYRFLHHTNLHKYTCNGTAIYSTSAKNHCHFINTETGEITHFAMEEVGPILKNAPGNVCHVQVEVHGTKFK